MSIPVTTTDNNVVTSRYNVKIVSIKKVVFYIKKAIVNVLLLFLK